VQLGRNRVEALTDGVFAVAMTLLVLDIKVPELEQSLATAELPLKLLSLWPKFLSYTISFVILGVYWVGHHVQLSFIRRADRPLLWINIFFLLWVALVPFSTALLSEYAKTRLAIAIYGANLIAIGLTLALHWWYATTESRHVDPDIDRGLVRGDVQDADGATRLRHCDWTVLLQSRDESGTVCARSNPVYPSGPHRYSLGWPPSRQIENGSGRREIESSIAGGAKWRSIS